MNISQWIQRHAMSKPGKVALRTAQNSYTYAQMETQIEAVACMLKGELGVGKGDRVAFLSSNCAEFLLTLFACARIGALFVPLNGRLTVPEHLYILQDADVKVLLLQEMFTELVVPVTAALPYCHIVGLDFAPAAGAAWQVLLASPHINPHDGQRTSQTPYVDLDTPLLIVYTSGTTGHPKGAVHTQASVQWNAIQGVLMSDLTAPDLVLNVLPLFHVGGMNVQTLPAFYCGATVILHAQFIPDQTLTTIVDERVTTLHLVPAMINAVVNSPLWNDADFSQLRTVATGSTAVPSSCREVFETRGVQFVNLYGATETCPIAIYMRSDYQRDKLNAIGLPAPHCAVRVVDDDGREQPAGVTGEILVKGPNIMLEYWRNEAATTQALRNGWYHTGDMGYQDADGYLYIADRKKNLIIKGGENIYPAEVERVLDTHPAIVESAVIGLPDPEWQEVPVAVLVAAPGQKPTAAELRTFLLDKLADYKIPTSFVFTEELPRNALRKLQHFQVRAELQQNPALIAQLQVPGRAIVTIAPDLRQRILPQPHAARRSLLVEELQKIAAHTLGIEHTQAIDPTLTWIALGLDSLMLIRLRNVLMEAVGQALPATLFFDYPTAETLADYLLQEIATEKQPDASGVSDITILPSDWPPVVVEQSAVEQSAVEQSAVERTTVRNCEPSVTMQMYYEWYTAALVSGEGSYLHVPFPLRIGADVDATALQQACQALVDRHQAFRSTFVQTDGALIHCVHPSRRVDFEVIAAQSWTDDKLQRQIEASVAQPFDFTQDSLVRFRLFTRNQDAILLITFHHIIMDGGSSPTFFRELEICYRAFAAGDSPSLPSVPPTLVDFNRWLQAVWASPAGGKLAAHWRQKIAGLQPLRSHIFDRQPQPTGPLSNAGKEHHFHFDPALYQAMVALAERNGLTINNICLAGFMLLLACYTEQDDVVVGSSSMNRSNPEFAHVIGCLANNPLIRVTIADDPTLETFVQRVRNAFFDTYTHQTYSWKFIKALLVEAGHEIQSVLFPFTYAFQHFESVNKLEAVNMADDRDVTDHAGMGLSLEPYHGQGLALRPEAWSYLGIELSSTGESIGGFAHYYSDLFDEATVARLMAQYQELLARIVAEPAVRLSTVRSLK